MNSFDLFGYSLNGLEFVTYILIPSSIILMILLYIYFNYGAISNSISYDGELDDFDLEKHVDIRNHINERHDYDL